MPRSKRQNILLRHDQALGAIEKAIDYLAELHDQFAPAHPEYAKGYKNILTMLALAHDFLEKMKGFV